MLLNFLLKVEVYDYTFVKPFGKAQPKFNSSTSPGYIIINFINIKLFKFLKRFFTPLCADADRVC